MKYTATIDGESIEVELIRIDATSVEAVVSGEKYFLEIEAVEPGVYWMQWNHCSIEVSVTPHGEAYVVSVGSQRAEDLQGNGYGAQEWGAPHRSE